MIWALGGLLFVVAAALAVQDPRRLRVGVLVTAGVLVLVVAAWGGTGARWAGWVAALTLGLFSVTNGVTMLRRTGRGRSDQVSLVFGLAVLGWAVATVARDGLVVRVIGAPLAYLGSVLIAFVGYGVLYGLAARWWARPVDAVIVLGAGLRGTDVTPMLASRLATGRQVLERSRARGRDTHLICSGGQGADEVVPEAVAMADHLAAAGVDRALLWLEDASTSTEENLRLSADVAAAHGVTDGRFAVVTNDFHVLRAAWLMRTIGLRGQGIGARTALQLWPSSVLREYAAILWEHRVLNALALLAVTAAALGLG